MDGGKSTSFVRDSSLEKIEGGLQQSQSSSIKDGPRTPDERRASTSVPVLDLSDDEQETSDDILSAMIQSKDSKTDSFLAQFEIKETTAVETEIQRTLQMMQDENAHDQDPHYQTLQTEYNKLFNLFQESRANEQKLVTKCKEITSELGSNSAKIQAALKLSQNDRSQITVLKKEVKRAWKMLDSSNEKEGRSRDVVASLRNEMDNLRRVIDSHGLSSSIPGGILANGKKDDSPSSDDSLVELLKEKEDLAQELNRVQLRTSTMQSTIDELEDRVGSLRSDKAALEHEQNTLKDLLATKKGEQDRDGQARDKLEIQLRQAGDLVNRKDSEINSKNTESRQLKDMLSKLDSQIRDEKTRMEKLEKDRDHSNARLVRLQQEYEDQLLTTTRLLNENQNQSNALKIWEEQLTHFKEEFKNVARNRDSLQKRLKSTEEAKADAEMERDKYRSTSHSLQRDLDNMKKDIEFTNDQIEELHREREISHKTLVKSSGQTQKQATLTKISEQAKRTLEHEIMGYKEEASKMRKLIFTLEKERDKFMQDVSGVYTQLQSKDEESKLKDLTVFDQKKKICELERKLKEQQTLYEQVRADRNLYSKNLIESQDEIVETKRKLKIMSHQIEQLKEEISNKEAALVKEHFEHSKLEKEKEALSSQIAKFQSQYEESQQMIQNQQSEEHKLRHIIAEADADRLKLKKDYDAVVQERDILGTQLIRRNDELSLLYEKIKIQASTLNKGEIQYRERLEDIRVLKLEIKKLRREKAILQTETQNVDGLRNEIFRLQKDLLRERTRIKILEEELESPMNIHRWRKLAGSDPPTYELITKIQTLQKRLISKTEEVVEKELVINQKEKLYKEIKDVLQRQPGPEVLEELRVVKEAVKGKNRECKSLASELNMYHSQVNENKYEIDRLNRELQELRKRYYDNKKRESASSINVKKFAEPNFIYATAAGKIKPNAAHGTKFLGGGFSLSSNGIPIGVLPAGDL